MITPATDQHPYFNQRVPFRALRAQDFSAVLGAQSSEHDVSIDSSGRMALEERPVAEVAAVGTGLIALLVGLLGVIAPLLLARRTRRQLASSPLGAVLRFGALGLAFMFVEIALMQQVTRVLGHPSLAFAVVLAAVLMGSGLSSQWLAPRLSHRARPVRSAPWLAAAATGLVAVTTPMLLGALEAAPLWLRVLGTAALCGLSGLAMGLPFPAALGDLARRGGSVPWAFGVNGFASVSAPALAVVLGAELGLTATLLVGSLLYLVAGFERDPDA